MPRIHPIFVIAAVPLLAAAILTLEYTAQVTRVNGLIDGLKSYDPSAQQSAIQALGDLGKSAIDPLIGALKESDQHLQQNAAAALGKIGEPAILPLIAALKDADTHQQQGIAAALEAIGAPAVDPLLAAMKSDSSTEAQRNALMQALGKMGDRAIRPLIGLLDSDNSEQRQSAAAALGTIGQPAVEPLIEALKNTSGGSVIDRDRTIANILAQIGRPAVDPLIEVLQVRNTEDGWHARWSAAAALGQIRNPRALAQLSLNAHSDTDSDVRSSAAQAIAAIRGSPLPVSSSNGKDSQSASDTSDQSSETESDSPAHGLAGSVWDVTESNGDSEVFTFRSGGELHYTYQGQEQTNGVWAQNGPTVSVTIGDSFHYQGHVSGAHISGSVRNDSDQSWTWRAERR